MPPRLYVNDTHLGATQDTFALPERAARHAQVLRLQPGDPLILFDGNGGQWTAEVARMGRREVSVRLGAHDPRERELAHPVTLAVGMPANERFDWLIEKATELGVARIQPLMCERSVLRVSGERAERKREHWQGIATAAAEQCGRTRIPLVDAVQSLGEWLRQLPSPATAAQRWLLSPAATRRWQAPAATPNAPQCFLSGPEGGLSPQEEALAQTAGLFVPVQLGPRTLRAETAPLVVLVTLGG